MCKRKESELQVSGVPGALLGRRTQHAHPSHVQNQELLPCHSPSSSHVSRNDVVSEALLRCGPKAAAGSASVKASDIVVSPEL